jgi:prepilin-type N-terminal cleavage/methylation domain-containing protein
MKRQRGFTLLEQLLVLLILAVLAALALSLHGWTTQRARTEHVVSRIEHIAAMVRIRNRTEGAVLELGAEPGRAPPRLGGLLADADFRGDAGVELWLVKAPPGVFPAYPDRATYALVASAPSPAGLVALRHLHASLPQAGADAPWLDLASFVFPLEAAGAAAPPTAECNRGSWWETSQSELKGSSWRSSATLVACAAAGTPMDDTTRARVRIVELMRTPDGALAERVRDEVKPLQGGRGRFGTEANAETDLVVFVRYALLAVEPRGGQRPAAPWDGVLPEVVVQAPFVASAVARRGL